ncbi:hypothetical protein [Malaciobacter mytili]|uniref:hypothetical protein n=1 Tax=Malaciobacter mytili TaxID=603050 RepID=UPI003A855CAE
MKNILLFITVLVFFTACTPSTINKVSLSSNKIILENKNIIHTFNECTNFSYYVNEENKEYGKLFIEYIDLNSNCKWNGFQRGFFEELFKSTLKIKSMKIVEQFDYKNFEFTTYLIDEKQYLNLIYNYEVFKDIFILDYSGKLSQEYIQKFDNLYKSKYLNKNRFLKKYNKSLVNMATFNGYFSKEKFLLD